MARTNVSGPFRSTEGFEVGAGAVVTQVITPTGAIRPGGAASTPLTQVVLYTPSLTPVSVAAATVAEQSFTVTGLATTDRVFAIAPGITAGTGIVNARVSAANTLLIAFVNATAGAVTPLAGTYQVVAFRF